MVHMKNRLDSRTSPARGNGLLVSELRRIPISIAVQFRSSLGQKELEACKHAGFPPPEARGMQPTKKLVLYRGVGENDFMLL